MIARPATTVSSGSRTGVALMASVLMLVLASPVSAKVLARVDGDEITDEDVRTALSDIGPTMPQMAPAARQTYALDYLIETKLVAHRAAKEKVGEGDEFARRMAYFREKLLMQGLLGRTARSAATDDALRKTYDNAAKAQKPQEEIHARHILLPSEAEAKAALKRIQNGEDFAKVATELSKDPGGAGGDLGWFTKDRMVPEFAEAAFKLQAGELSQPVKTQFGWHIIKVEERRLQPFPAFDQVKDQIGRFVVQKAQAALIQSLRDQAKIEKIEPDPKDPEAPASAAGGPDPEPALNRHNRIDADTKP